MTAQSLHQQMLDELEIELKGLGCVLDEDYRAHVARVFDRMDQVASREDAEALYSEVGGELRDPSKAVICSPNVWLHAVECA
jgi:hypothetical protein